MFVASFYSMFMQSPNMSHRKVEKRILRYIEGTLYYGFPYTHFEDNSLSGYTNNYYAGILHDHKRNSWYAF